MPVAFIFFREKVRPFPHLAKRVNNKGRAVAEAFGNALLAEIDEVGGAIVCSGGCNTNQKDSRITKGTVRRWLVESTSRI
jgi:hypothetical protein